MDANYEPDGELEMLCLTRRYYDFTNDTQFDEEMNSLVSELKSLKRPTSGMQPI